MSDTVATSVATTVADDYLKTICQHTEWQPEPITPSQLAIALALAPSSVTEMVKKLAAADLVDHKPYGAITLTDAGRARALAMLRRHRLIETWLVERHDYGWDEVHDEAEVLEHALSDRLLDRIDAELGHPTRDPHGDLIPAKDGTIIRPDAVRLDEAAPGTAGDVVRISDRDPDVLRTLDELAITLDERVRVAETPRDPDAVTLDRASGATITVDAAVARAIWLAV